jgi:hypothetical protein
MTRQTQLLLHDAYSPMQYGNTKAFNAHINQLERCAALVRRLAKRNCEAKRQMRYSCDERLQLFHNTANVCLPCQARRVLKDIQSLKV